MYKFIVSILFMFMCVASVFASTVRSNVWEVQSPASYTAPIGFEDKWFIGSIIAQIFSPVWQILSQYILAFQNIMSSDNNIPVWNESTGVFDIGTLYDVSWNIWVWLSLPQTQLHASGVWRFDGGIEIDGNQIVTPSWNGIAAHSPDPNRYWFFKVWNGNGEEWAYFGYWNGEDRVNLALRWDADKLIISWWNVGISTVSPTHTLDVNGKIRMRNQTVNSDNDDVVVTKWYLDDMIASTWDSIIPGWPDVMVCVMSNGSVLVQYIDYAPFRTWVTTYRTPASWDNYIESVFNSDKTWIWGTSSDCTGKSIPTLISEWKAFNLRGITNRYESIIPICNGTNKAIGWDWTNWTCNTVS